MGFQVKAQGEHIVVEVERFKIETVLVTIVVGDDAFSLT
jgi:hypothetical protein